MAHSHTHHHSHDHHHHDHGHHHAPANFGRAFAIGIALNTLFIVIEIIYGLRANSLALLADAGHNAGDVLGLVVAWGAMWLTKREPNARYTYGLQSSSILAALVNALFLLVAVGGIAWEAIGRISHPQSVTGNTIMIVAAIGILINGFTALLFMKGRKGDLNIRGAFLHMATDAAISLGVVISGLIILKTGWLWLDPVASLSIALIIMFSTWGLLRDSINLALHAVPTNIDHAKVKAFLAGIEGVKEVHDLHIWAMSTTTVALSAHLLMPGGHPGDKFLKTIAHALEHDFGINHMTVQIELSGTDCDLAPDNVV
jgi:cobalt-zinc-cadmium efflux system protein